MGFEQKKGAALVAKMAESQQRLLNIRVGKVSRLSVRILWCELERRRQAKDIIIPVLGPGSLAGHWFFWLEANVAALWLFLAALACGSSLLTRQQHKKHGPVVTAFQSTKRLPLFGLVQKDPPHPFLLSCSSPFRPHPLHPHPYPLYFYPLIPKNNLVS